MANRGSHIFPPISELMRQEWDRRVDHDYRFWMSDGVESDEQMWKAGERDFGFFINGIDRISARNQTAIEIGCGVGRLLRSASAVFNEVIGIDVSPRALTRARMLLADVPNVRFVLGNGLDLSPIPSKSADFVYSFAALSSMPIEVISAYLLESGRIVKDSGYVRLQLYLGRLQDTVVQDTIAIRSLPEDRFISAMGRIGFDIESIEELVLPFEISSKEKGLVAKIVCLRKVGEPEIGLDELKNILGAESEQNARQTWHGSETECLMALSRLKQHLDAGDLVCAREAMNYARSVYSGQDELLVKFESDLEAQECRAHHEMPVSRDPSVVSIVPSALSSESSGAVFFQRNMEIIRQRFPQAHSLLQGVHTCESIRIADSEEGEPVVFLNGIPLDQPSKPRRAARVWAERTLTSERVKSAKDLIVAGFAGGYHIEELLQLSGKSVRVVENNAQMLKAVLSIRDLSALLNNISALHLDFKHWDTPSASGGEQIRGDSQLVVHPQTRAAGGKWVSELQRVFWSDRGFAELNPSIGVVGPVYGGTQPMAIYTSDALRRLGCQVSHYDLGGFYNAYKQINHFVRDSARLSTMQSYYVEMLSQLVLEGISEKPVDILICMAQAPMSERVLKEIRRRGIITVLWFVEDCRRFDTWEAIARSYDYVFMIQKEPFIDLVEQAGAGRAIYLPSACDPCVHRPLELTHEENKRWGSALSFVGAGYNNRRHMFARFVGRDFKIWGSEWPGVRPFDRLVQEGGRRIDVDEYVKIFNAAQINLNLHSSSERDGVDPQGDFINPRTFELAACGAFQLVDRRTLLGELFDTESELVTFGDAPELEDKIEYYLAHPQERAAYAARARDKVLSEHTYEHRLKKMLGYIFADRYEQLAARNKKDGWSRALKAAKEQPELEQLYVEAKGKGFEPSLEALVANIAIGQGPLSEAERKLLFLHHVRDQVSYVNRLRAGQES